MTSGHIKGGEVSGPPCRMLVTAPVLLLLFNVLIGSCSGQVSVCFLRDPRNQEKSKVRVRPAQLAELSRSEFDPELFSHSSYVKFFVTFATKVPY